MTTDGLRCRDFLTGFHKRKLQKKEAAKKKAMDREKEQLLEARREVRLRYSLVRDRRMLTGMPLSATKTTCRTSQEECRGG